MADANTPLGTFTFPHHRAYHTVPDLPQLAQLLISDVTSRSSPSQMTPMAWKPPQFTVPVVIPLEPQQSQYPFSLSSRGFSSKRNSDASRSEPAPPASVPNCFPPIQITIHWDRPCMQLWGTLSDTVASSSRHVLGAEICTPVINEPLIWSADNSHLRQLHLVFAYVFES
jgi:hypothetical protein